MIKPVLALDLARVSGWAFGEPGGQPVHGMIQFAAAGASHEAVFHKAMFWIQNKIMEVKPTLIVWEAPLATSMKRGSTNVDTTTLLYGLPAIVGAIGYMHGIYDMRKADTRLDGAARPCCCLSKIRVHETVKARSGHSFAVSGKTMLHAKAVRPSRT